MKILDVPRSGSYQGITSSRNRFGQYVRTRAIPVNPSTSFQSNVRARLAANAAAWRGLTDEQRAGWASLALLMSRTDSLGQSYTPTGFGAFVAVNNNNDAAGNASVDDAPAYITPTALDTVTPAADSALGTFSLAYTPTPLGAGIRIFVYASPPRSAGRDFEFDFRLIFVSAAAAASPADIAAAYTARFGALVAGTKIFVSVSTYEGGFVSAPFKTSAIVS